MRVHIWGASGYAAAEAIRLLEQHPHFELGALESASHAGTPLAREFALLRKSTRSFDGPGAVVAAVRKGDYVVMAGAHGSAVAQAPVFLAAGARVVDLSQDFRASNEAVYGLPERYFEAIAGAQLVANPGCYPTATLLALLPLAAFGAPRQLIVDAKSGITGAGRVPSTEKLFAEVQGDVRPYALDGHRHQPEIERQLGAAGIVAPLVFTPQVVPLARGMLSDAYAIFDAPLDEAAVRAAYERYYAENPFVRVVPDAPSIVAVEGTNDAEVHVDVVGNVVRALCSIDNLGKGAAGQAVQNLNIMAGVPQESGL
jgi:N-acetyl-gamma-glutamyl-phosphate reductase